MTRPLKLTIAGLLAGLLPFVVFVGTTYQQTVNGVLVVDDEQNFAGYAGGVLALVLAWIIVVRPERPADREPRWRAAGAAVAAVGVVQLVYSAGLFG